MSRKEFGSDFNLCQNQKWLVQGQTDFFDLKATNLYVSGRAALYALLEYGISTYNWQKVYLPSYYCYDVNNYLVDLNIDVVIYDYNPFTNQSTFNIIDHEHHVIVNTNYFGFGTLNLSHYKKAIIAADYTHALSKAYLATAHYVFGSLRKELPLPVGGFLLSKHHKIPKGQFNFEANNLAQKKLTAMHLKSLYLQNKATSKDVFRNLFADAEHALDEKLKSAVMPEISTTILKQLNVTKILKQKEINLKIALENLKLPDTVQLNNNKSKGFGLTFKFQSKKTRDNLKSHLIKHNIFPAVLWPGQKTHLDKQVEDSLLFIHIDYRYNQGDIIFITNTINVFFNA